MINSKESNNLSFFQESPHLNSPVSFHKARESCNLYLFVGLKIGQTLPSPPIYSTIFFFELVIIFFNSLQWNPWIISSTGTIFTF